MRIHIISQAIRSSVMHRIVHKWCRIKMNNGLTLDDSLTVDSEEYFVMSLATTKHGV